MVHCNQSLSVKGFTLIEVLVAMFIFGIMSALAYGGLNSILETKAYSEIQTERLSELQLAFRVIARDLEQANLREIRDEFGDKQPAFRAGGIGDFRIELTRSGWRNPAERSRSTLQRVAYEYTGDALFRVYWPVLDRAQDTEPVRLQLLQGVNDFQLRFMDEENQFHTSWPKDESRATSGALQSSLPKAIEVTLELNDWGTFTRLLLCAEGEAS